MSNQIVISSGAKVRSLEGVLTGTAGIVNSVPLGGANGVATLDALGKVPLSQLPASVVTYLGTWNAATNTPTLTNGVGDVGDLYICNVAGTVNFGAGPITFAVGDWVIYSGTEWQKSAGASGTVTSVALTESGDALTITGSPITTSGTINIGFAGTGSQYIKGDGTLATFPTTIDQAKRLITEVYNSTGATLTKGTVVYINGGQGNLPTVTKAQANNDANSAQTYGVVQDDITNNNNGFVVVLGSLTDLDTSAYVVGTQLYLSGTTAGAWTSTKPSAPIHLVYVAIVVRSHPTQGVVEVRIQNGYELEEIHDVAISAPVNNQGIFYNSSNDLWENKSIATALGYTPANDALVVHLAGTETITGQKTFSLATKQDFGTLLKNGSMSALAGYTGIGGGSLGNGLDIILNGSGFTQSLLFQTGAGYSYTYPAITGTLALLEGTQTFIGDKTFSGYALMDIGVTLAKTSGTPLYGSTNGYANLQLVNAGSVNSLYLIDGDTGKYSKLSFNNAADYTYTFPASSGTLALTSNLSSYVPYTGATADVNLGIWGLTSTNTIQGAAIVAAATGATGGEIYLSQGSTFGTFSGYSAIGATSTGAFVFLSDVSSGTAVKDARLNFGSLTNNTTRTYTFPDATGTLVLGSGTTNYLPKFTGASTIGNSAITDDGTTVTLVSRALSGTSATFSDLVTTTSVYRIVQASASRGGLYTYNQVAGSGTDYSLGIASEGEAFITTGGTATKRLVVTSGGNVGIGTDSPNFKAHISTGSTTSITQPTAGTYGLYIQQNTSGNVGGLYIQDGASNSGNSIFVGDNNGAPRFVVNTDGNVGIGTSSPSSLLTMSTTSGNTIIRLIRTDTAATTNNFGSIIFDNSVGTTLASIRAKSDSGNTNSALVFSAGTADTERMRITSGGSVLVGKTNDADTGQGVRLTASGLVQCTRDQADPLSVNRTTNDGTLVSLRQDGTQEGTISVSGTTVSYNGGHLARYTQTESNQRIEGLLKGTVMSNLDKMAEWINPETGEPYANEQLNCMKISDVEGDINVAGVFVNWDDDDKSFTSDMNIAMTGDMIIRIAQGVIVEKGQLLMSAGDGTAKPQEDDIVRSKTIAKVTSNNVTCVYEDGSYCVPCVLMAC